MQERLQKIIARAGIASRRHAEQLILSGQVRVNGHVVTELGTKADAAQDRIEAAGRVVKEQERRVYLVLNKPPEIVSSMADPEGRKTLKNCLRGFPERVYPVGNLEYTASGLVFLTNDGDLAAEMLKHWGELEQVYLVKEQERRVYLVLNKPPEIVSSMADPEGRKTLKNCLRGFPERVYPVGNLEYTASGLVFLTNDGDLAAEMLKHWGELEQVYLVK